MNILVSGGWGYGNIGDDAILEATSKLINAVDPAADVRWMTYDVDFTMQSGVELKGEIGYSVHRENDHGGAFHYLQTIGKSVPAAMWPKVPRRVYERFIRTMYVGLTSRFDRKVCNEDWFDWADIFVMSGGGYFNSWETMFDARVKEIELARRHGCKVLLIGQSFGPFIPKQKSILAHVLNKGEVIVARDSESVFELKTLGVSVGLMPDLAMGFTSEVAISKGLLVVVPAELNKMQGYALSQNLIRCFKRRLFSSLRIVLTRYIYPDVATARQIKSILEKYGVIVDLRIPENYSELIKSISGAEIVVSRGLHAMILGWRSGSKVLALTKSRKVDGFLRAIGSSTNQTISDAWDDLSEKLFDVQHEDFNINCRIEVVNKVKVGFSDAFEGLI